MSEHGSPVENSGSDVAGPKGRELNAGQKLGLVALIGVVALGFIWFNFLLRKNAPAAEKPAIAASGPGLKYTPPPADKTPSSDALPLPAAASTLDTTKADASPPPILAYSGGGMAGGVGMRAGRTRYSRAGRRRYQRWRNRRNNRTRAQRAAVQLGPAA